MFCGFRRHKNDGDIAPQYHPQFHKNKEAFAYAKAKVLKNEQYDSVRARFARK